MLMEWQWSGRPVSGTRRCAHAKISAKIRREKKIESNKDRWKGTYRKYCYFYWFLTPTVWFNVLTWSDAISDVSNSEMFCWAASAIVKWAQQLVLIYHLCAFSGWVGVNCGANRVSRMHTSSSRAQKANGQGQDIR